MGPVDGAWQDLVLHRLEAAPQAASMHVAVTSSTVPTLCRRNITPDWKKMMIYGKSSATTFNRHRRTSGAQRNQVTTRSLWLRRHPPSPLVIAFAVDLETILCTKAIAICIAVVLFSACLLLCMLLTQSSTRVVLLLLCSGVNPRGCKPQKLVADGGQNIYDNWRLTLELEIKRHH